MIRNAYYLAALDQTFGDAEYGQGLRELYDKFMGTCVSTDENGKVKRHSTKFCGVSRYDYAEPRDPPNRVKTVLVIKNFFDEKYSAFSFLEIG